jgi:hypothetical protein
VPATTAGHVIRSDAGLSCFCGPAFSDPDSAFFQLLVPDNELRLEGHECKHMRWNDAWCAIRSRLSGVHLTVRRVRIPVAGE